MIPNMRELRGSFIVTSGDQPIEGEMDDSFTGINI